MYRIDDATAATSLPTPEAAGTEGYFTEGNPATGTPATKVRASWLNMLQEEFCSILTAAGMTRSKTSYNQVLTAITSLVRSGYQGATRVRLTANTNFYVNASTGNDSNNGLTSGTAWATLQNAYDVVRKNYDLSGFVATINVASGTYAALNAQGPCVGTTAPASVIFSGSGATVSTSTGSACFSAQTGAQYSVSGFTVVCSTNGGSGIAAVGGGSILSLGASMVFGACSGSHMLASGGGQILGTANYSITGSAGAHMNAANGGAVSVGSSLSVTLTGTPTFSTAFALATGLSQINSGGNTYTGSANGTRYNVASNAMVNTASGGSSYFPGGAAGITGTGGIYI